RLQSLMARLRDGRVHRAEDLAEALKVSVRTIYRDLNALIAAGAPVEGTRGAGFRITAQLTLPPISLTPEELEALHLGLSIVREVGDAELSGAAEGLSEKVDQVLPEEGRLPEGWGFAVYPFAEGSKTFHLMPTIRNAVRSSHKLELTYRESEEMTHQVIWPLSLEFWGGIWTFVAWCEKRRGFHVFRIDRIARLRQLEATFPAVPGRRHEDYLALQ
ncbi:MAG: YafY family protein, partial [Pseudomonadota bacterium]